MSKKHYILIAEAIHRAFRQCQTDGERIIVTGAAKEIAKSLELNNPTFQYARFLRACGVLKEGDL